MRIASQVNSVSKTPVNLLLRSRAKKRELSCLVAEVHEEIPYLLSYPGTGGFAIMPNRWTRGWRAR